MSCINDSLIQKYIDGESSQSEMNWIEDHMAHCQKCAAKVENQRKLSTEIKEAMSLIGTGTIDVPEIGMAVNKSTKRSASFKRYIYYASAACILLFVFILTRNNELKGQAETIVTYKLDSDYDANKTITQQKLVIHFMDTEGEVTKYYIE